MTKGHNKGISEDRMPEDKGQGQDRKLTDQKKNKSHNQGRNPKGEDPSDGTKGKNAI